MDGRPTEPLRHEHADLATHLAHLRTAVDDAWHRPAAAEAAALDGVVAFLRDELRPHAAWEEQHLYPALDAVLRTHGRPTATMTVDHQVLLEKIDAFARVVAALQARTAREGADAAELADRVRLLGYEIAAILELHFRKEEDVYLDLLDRCADPREVRSLVSRARWAGHHH